MPQFIFYGHDFETGNAMLAVISHSTLLEARDCVQAQNPNMVIERGEANEHAKDDE